MPTQVDADEIEDTRALAELDAELEQAMDASSALRASGASAAECWDTFCKMRRAQRLARHGLP